MRVVELFAGVGGFRIGLERLNMFSDNHTQHPLVSDTKRSFLMGNALVCGVVTELGKSLYTNG